MTRFSVWLLCCAVILVTLATMGGNVNIYKLLGLFAYIGMPLMIHWAFSPTKVTEGDQNV